jgi:hypothetical protein
MELAELVVPGELERPLAVVAGLGLTRRPQRPEHGRRGGEEQQQHGE